MMYSLFVYSESKCLVCKCEMFRSAGKISVHKETHSGGLTKPTVWAGPSAPALGEVLSPLLLSMGQPCPKDSVRKVLICL